MRRHRHLVATGLAAAFAAATSVGLSARPADAAHAVSSKARHTVSCWASLSGPTYSAGNVVASVTWQCTPGTMQQMSPYISLTAPNGTRYTMPNTCVNTTFCPVSVSAPYSGGTWKAQADYLYVVDYTGVGQYFFGPSNSLYL
jgi:hypothetical protein